MAASAISVHRYFARRRDPRRNRHLLIDIIVITLCGVIGGANHWQEIAPSPAAGGGCTPSWPCPTASPHDTLERAFDRLDPQAFRACFRQWVEALAQALDLGHTAIDGKALRRSGSAPKGWAPLQVVSAWATPCHLTLGQVTVDDKSDEITAIARLLELLDLKGALVTIDAMGCQKGIAKKVVQGGGDGVLAVKGNQPHLLEDIQAVIGQALESDVAGYRHDWHEAVERGHGRGQTRTYLVLTEPEGIRDQESWLGLKVVGMCTRARVVNGGRGDEAH